MKKENTPKKHYGKLGTKISLLVALSFFAVIVTLLLLSMDKVEQMTEDIFIRQSNTAAATLSRELDNATLRITAAAEQLATNRLYGEGIRDKTLTPMKQPLILGVNNAAASLGLLVDKQGEVVLNATGAPEGNLATGEAVAGALGGNTTTAIEPLGDCPLAIVTAEPVYADGRVSGALVLAIDLRESTMIDKLKSIDGNEYTIFAGDTRISTTLVQDGNRVVGTKLAPAVADVVIHQGQPHTGRTEILGQDHLCTYLPLKNSSGQVIGILFSGTNAETMRGNLVATFKTIGGIAILLLIIIVAGLWLLLRLWVTRPLGRLVAISNSIADGNLTVSMDAHFGNELGVLAESFGQTVTRLGNYMGYIHEVSDVLGQIADGDLDYKLERDYAGEFCSIKAALEQLSERLNHTLRQMSHSSSLVHEGAHKLSGDSQNLAQGATEQASAVEELSSSISLLSQQIGDNARSAGSATEIAMQVGEDLNDSSVRMQEMTAAMSDISTRSAEIGKIIKTIDDIAFRTNILALNAAVEAARAGVAGKGFAVVAGEVRSLAAKSAEAAKSTATLIEHSLVAVQQGNRIAGETAQSLYTLVEGVAAVVKSMRKITNATEEQSIEISQIRDGIELISNVVQQNSATSELSAAAAIELSQQSVAMQELVRRFNLKQSNN